MVFSSVAFTYSAPFPWTLARFGRTFYLILSRITACSGASFTLKFRLALAVDAHGLSGKTLATVHRCIHALTACN